MSSTTLLPIRTAPPPPHSVWLPTLLLCLLIGALPGLLPVMLFLPILDEKHDGFFLLAAVLFAGMGVLFLGLPLFAVLTLVGHFGRQNSRGILQAYYAFAARVGGEVTLQRVAFFGYDLPQAVHFRHGKTPCTLDIETFGSYRHRRHFMRIAFDLNRTVQFNCEIVPEDLISSLNTWLGGQEVKLGWEPFDNQFVVRTNDELRACDVIDSPVRQQLLDLLQIGCQLRSPRLGWVTLAVRDNRVRIRLTGYFVREDQLLEYYEATGRLFDQLEPRLR